MTCTICRSPMTCVILDWYCTNNDCGTGQGVTDRTPQVGDTIKLSKNVFAVVDEVRTTDLSVTMNNGTTSFIRRWLEVAFRPGDTVQSWRRRFHGVVQRAGYSDLYKNLVVIYLVKGTREHIAYPGDLERLA